MFRTDKEKFPGENKQTNLVKKTVLKNDEINNKMLIPEDQKTEWSNEEIEEKEGLENSDGEKQKNNNKECTNNKIIRKPELHIFKSQYK